MWRLFLSGLLCMPTLVLLAIAPRYASTVHLDPLIAPPAAVAGAEARPISISLPPAPSPAPTIQTEVEFGSAEYLPAARAGHEPAPPRPKPVQAIHAKSAVRRDTGVAQTPPQPTEDTPWARLGHWFAQHEAPKVWSPGGGEGFG